VSETTFTGTAALLDIRFYFAYGWVMGQLDECDLGQNNVPPYLHWLVVCGACRQLTLGRALTPCVPIVRFSSNEVVKCSSCSDVRQYLAAQFFLGPFPAPVQPTSSPVPRHRYTPTLVIAASIIAAVRLAREEDISGRSPRLMAAVANSVQLAKNILDTVRNRFPGEE
jgi:hypothetical protein